MANYAAYWPNGRIAVFFTSAEPVTQDFETGLPVAEIPGDVGIDIYLDLTTTPPRAEQSLPCPIQRVGRSFSGIPAPATVKVDEAEYVVTESDLDLEVEDAEPRYVVIRPDDPKYPVWTGVVTTE